MTNKFLHCIFYSYDLQVQCDLKNMHISENTAKDFSSASPSNLTLPETPKSVSFNLNEDQISGKLHSLYLFSF